MNDEFLYRLRESPRPEFAEALKARVFREQRRSLTACRVRAGLIGLLAALVIAACAAPQTRTPILKATETAITRGREIVTRFFLVSQGRPTRLVMTFPCGEGQDVRVETLSLSEAQKLVPFQIQLPTWVPEGLEMNPVTVIHPEGFGDWVVYIGWRGPYSGGVLMPEPGRAPLSLKIEGPGVQEFWSRCLKQLMERLMERREVVEVTPPAEEYRTLNINGKPTQVTVAREGVLYPHAMLTWVREEDNVSYTLGADLMTVSVEDLIRVAETIR